MNGKVRYCLALLGLVVFLLSTGARNNPAKNGGSTLTGTISVTPTVVTSSDPVNITYTKSTEGGDAVICLWDADNNTLLKDEYEGILLSTSGAMKIFPPRRTGHFTYRLCKAQTYELIAESNQIEVIEYTPTVKVSVMEYTPADPLPLDPPTVRPGAPLALEIHGASGLRGSRMYIADANTGVEVPNRSKDRPSETSLWGLDAPDTPGNYVVKLTRDETGKVIATSNTFIVLPPRPTSTQSPAPQPVPPAAAPSVPAAGSPVPGQPAASQPEPAQPAKPAAIIVLTIGSKNMTVDGVTKEIDPGKTTVPVVINGRTLLPVRAIIDSIGGNIEWDGSQQKVTIKADGSVIVLWLNKKNAVINGVSKTLDVAPLSIGGRTMLPGRFIAENLGYTVDWDQTAKTVTIRK